MSDTNSLVSSYLSGTECNGVLCTKLLHKVVYHLCFVVCKLVVLIQTEHVFDNIARFLEYESRVVSVLSVPPVPLLHVFLDYDFQHCRIDNGFGLILVVCRTEVLVPEHALF